MKGRESSSVHSAKAFPCPEIGGESFTGADAEVPQSHITFGARFFFPWNRRSVFMKTVSKSQCSPRQKLGSLSIIDRFIFLFVLISWELKVHILAPSLVSHGFLLPFSRKTSCSVLHNSSCRVDSRRECAEAVAVRGRVDALVYVLLGRLELRKPLSNPGVLSRKHAGKGGEIRVLRSIALSANKRKGEDDPWGLISMLYRHWVS